MSNESCVFADRARGDLVLCRNYQRWSRLAECERCQAFTPGTALPAAAIPQTVELVTDATQSHCKHLGEVVFGEACSCGSELQIAVHSCRSPDRLRGRRSRAWCVPLELSWDRLADPMARTSFRCCESCEFRQASAAPADRQNTDDQSEPIQSVEQ